MVAERLSEVELNAVERAIERAECNHHDSVLLSIRVARSLLEMALQLGDEEELQSELVWLEEELDDSEGEVAELQEQLKAALGDRDKALAKLKQQQP